MSFTTFAAVIVLISFLIFLGYTAKGGNLLIGLYIIATIWTTLSIIYGVKNLGPGDSVWNEVMRQIKEVYHGGPVGYGETTAIIIFASWFGRVLLDTGIAGELIKRVVEQSGDNRLSLVLIVSIVTSVIFMSIFGPGSVIAMGTIILPIFFSLGINKKLAVGAFLMAVASGMYVNGGYVSQFAGHSFFEKLFSENINGFTNKFTTFTWAATLTHIAIMIIYIIFMYNRTKNDVRTWSMPRKKKENNIHGLALSVPFIPVLMNLLVSIAQLRNPEIEGFSVIFTFIVGIFFGLLLTGNLKTYKIALESVQKTLQNAIGDVALLIGMLVAMNTFAKSAGLISPIISTTLGGSLDWIATNPQITVFIFMALAPLALFRGPFMIWGSGIALATVVNAVLTGGNPELTGTFALLLVLFYVQPVGITASTGPTQSWNMWALSYSDYSPREFLKNNFVWGWLITAANIFLAYKILM